MGLLLVVGTVAAIGSTPVYGGSTTPKLAASTDAQQEHRDIAAFNADVSRLNHDFAALPPEVNSALMYAGAGSAPLMAAAHAWDSLTSELQATMNSYSSVITGLAGDPWTGPASSSTASAAAPYVTWLETTAHQAEQLAQQAQAEAAAFETTQSSIVPNG